MQLADLLSKKFELIDDPTGSDDELTSNFWINKWSENGVAQGYELSDGEVGLFFHRQLTAYREVKRNVSIDSKIS